MSTTDTGAKIRQLSDQIANQIAAGEVVERPASVVKELLENSLDAGATAITLRFRNGGKSFIEVIDNGVGMNRDDALLAFERHATSKISDADDLRNVATLGFRGEALPSIASVSRLALQTSLPNAESGVSVTLAGGALKDVKEAPPLAGTTITIRDLFFNTPVRRKFLRSESVETDQLQEAFYRIAIARPDIAFRLERDGKNVVNAPAESGEMRLRRRIETLFGKRAVDEMTEVDYSYAGMRISGFISRPSYTRSNRSMQYIYINGRFIRDKLVGFAVNDGFRSILPKGRHPALFLELTMPPERVDVNVHPTKIEVRFIDGRSVTGLIRAGLQETLMGVREEPQVRGAENSPSPSPPPSDAWKSVWPEPSRKERPSYREPVAITEWESATPAPPPLSTPSLPFDDGELRQAEMTHYNGVIPDTFRVVGQVFESFLLLDTGNRLLLLDQHTTHERILYERFSHRYAERKVESQQLLFPLEITLGPRDAGLMARWLPALGKLGFGLEEFGERSYTLRAVPVLLGEQDWRLLLLDILDKSATAEESDTFDAIAEDVINIMACRGAVKAGDSLDTQEIEVLVKRLNSCELPYTCPHGRPVAFAIDRESLFKGFLRQP